MAHGGAAHPAAVLKSQKPIDLAILMQGTNNHMNLNARAITDGMGALAATVPTSDAGCGKAPP